MTPTPTPRPHEPVRTPDHLELDIVEESDLESFPASDPPPWTGAVPADVHPPADGPSDQPEPGAPTTEAVVP